MAITVTEKPDSRQTAGGSVTLTYYLRGTDDDAAAEAALLAAAPGTHNGLIREAYPSMEPVWVDTVAEDGLWQATVRYNPVAQQTLPAVGESSYQFDTSGGTQHITQSIATIARYAIGAATPPDSKGAIGVAGPDSAVEGVDVTTPVYTWSETHYLSAATVTDAYKLVLFSLTGTVNNKTFKGMAAGEVLFLGASGSKRGASDWEITFRFAASPNKTGLTVGAITGIAKKGWEYLWVRYQETVDEGVRVKQPLAAFVEKVYEDGDFDLLGI